MKNLKEIVLDEVVLAGEVVDYMLTTSEWTDLLLAVPSKLVMECSPIEEIEDEVEIISIQFNKDELSVFITINGEVNEINKPMSILK